jgi:hypothetical protein
MLESPRKRDLVLSIVLDGFFEGTNQVLLVLYYALWVNKTGLDFTNILSVVSNVAGILNRLRRLIIINASPVKPSVKTATLTSSVLMVKSSSASS